MDRIQPFRATRVLGAGISWYLGNLRTILPLSFIAVLPELLCYLVFSGWGSEESLLVTGSVVTHVVSMMSGTWLVAVLTHAAVTNMTSGHNPPWQDSIAWSLRVYPPLLLLSILLSVVVGAGLFLLIAPGVVLWVMFRVAVPALVIQRTGVLESFGRSRELTSGSRWRLFLMLLGELLVILIVSFLIGCAYFLWAWIAWGISTGDEWNTLFAPRSPVLQALHWVLPWGISAAIGAAAFVELHAPEDHSGRFRR